MANRIYILLLILGFISCNSDRNNRPIGFSENRKSYAHNTILDYLDIIKSYHTDTTCRTKKTISANEDINPDLSINDIYLLDLSSIKNKTGGNFYQPDSFCNFHVLSALNRDKSQLFFIENQYLGDTSTILMSSKFKVTFRARFFEKKHFKYKTIKDDLKIKNAITTKYSAFKTEKGIQLGMSEKNIINKIGTPYSKYQINCNQTILEYEMWRDKKPASLRKYSQFDTYFAIYKLENDSLYEFYFGVCDHYYPYDYP